MAVRGRVKTGCGWRDFIPGCDPSSLVRDVVNHRDGKILPAFHYTIDQAETAGNTRWSRGETKTAEKIILADN